MLDRLSAALNFYTQALDLRAQRENVLASNIANSDTPHYKARDFDFKNALDNALSSGTSGAGNNGLAVATTAPGHIAGRGSAATGGLELVYRTPTQPGLDGNTVDMNAQRVAFMQNAIHYRADLQILSGQIKQLKAAMQPV